MAFELFQASLAQGHDAYLISALEASHEEVHGKPGAPIVPVHGEAKQYFYFPQWYDLRHLSIGDWRSLQFFRALIEELRPDVIHFHHYHRVGVESIKACRLAAPDAIICLTFHEMMAICLADGQMITTTERQLCRAATPIACSHCFPQIRPEQFTLREQRLKAILDEVDVYLFPSEFLAGRYIDWGLAPKKSAVIPNGQIDLSDGFDRTGHSQALNRFGFFGQFIDNKGIDVILKALLILVRDKRVPRAGLVFEINASNKHYASAAYLEKIKGLLEDLLEHKNSGIQIIDRDRYGREELPRRMRSIDWVIVPSTWWEVFGLVVSEAWMFGRPVITSDIAGLHERVQNDQNGFTFPVGDAESLAEMIVMLVGNEDAWNRTNLGIEQPWSEVHMLNAHLSVWEEMRRERLTHVSHVP